MAVIQIASCSFRVPTDEITPGSVIHVDQEFMVSSLLVDG